MLMGMQVSSIIFVPSDSSRLQVKIICMYKPNRQMNTQKKSQKNTKMNSLIHFSLSSSEQNKSVLAQHITCSFIALIEIEFRTLSPLSQRRVKKLLYQMDERSSLLEICGWLRHAEITAYQIKSNQNPLSCLFLSYTLFSCK